MGQPSNVVWSVKLNFTVIGHDIVWGSLLVISGTLRRWFRFLFAKQTFHFFCNNFHLSSFYDEWFMIFAVLMKIYAVKCSWEPPLRSMCDGWTLMETCILEMFIDPTKNREAKGNPFCSIITFVQTVSRLSGRTRKIIFRDTSPLQLDDGCSSALHHFTVAELNKMPWMM